MRPVGLIRWTLLICLIVACAADAGAFEVSVPVDGSSVHGSSVAIVVRPNHPDLRVAVNGELQEPFVSNPRYGNSAHGRLTLMPGDNIVTVSVGADDHQVRVQSRPYYGLVKKNNRENSGSPFHIPERERECAECHRMVVDAATRKPAIRSDSICTSCHDDLTRSDFLHGPVGAFICLACHEEASDGPKYSVVKVESEHCNGCHKTKQEVSDQRYVHGPLAVGKCIVCHDPHGSQVKYQLHDANSALCFGCHVQLKHEIEAETAISHQVIRDQGCTACHDPHASQHSPHLRQSAEELCISCHDKNNLGEYTSRQHPVIGHPSRGVPDPRQLDQQISCTTCHQPHSSAAPGLLRAEDYLQLCMQCHKK
ncbi:MAG: hypothetical protein GY906_27045 [bacterium]|nr:hypothetical protein [bacterium]